MLSVSLLISSFQKNMSRNFDPFFYIKSLYKMGQDFLNKQYSVSTGSKWYKSAQLQPAKVPVFAIWVWEPVLSWRWSCCCSDGGTALLMSYCVDQAASHPSSSCCLTNDDTAYRLNIRPTIYVVQYQTVFCPCPKNASKGTKTTQHRNKISCLQSSYCLSKMCRPISYYSNFLYKMG